MILKIKAIVFLFIVLNIGYVLTVNAQHKTFSLSPNGDTLNAVDNKGLKQANG